MTELEAWTEKLIDSGTELIEHRINFIKEFNNYIRDSYKTIMGNDEIPGISLFLPGRLQRC